jgi:ABC-type long-subunit fatty acid transport system fused permease/ATPase subunit
MPSDAEAQDITLRRSAIVTMLMVARWVSGALALGLLALIAMALMQRRENGRYQGIVDGWTLIIQLSTSEAQHRFVASVVHSLAQAYVEPWWTPLAIYFVCCSQCVDQHAQRLFNLSWFSIHLGQRSATQDHPCS